MDVEVRCREPISGCDWFGFVWKQIKNLQGYTDTLEALFGHLMEDAPHNFLEELELMLAICDYETDWGDAKLPVRSLQNKSR